MNEERRDTSLFIGLHKLAAQNGDGLVPELYALLTARAEAAADMTNVVTMPKVERTRSVDVAEFESARVLSFKR
jgi:predicted nucleic acid-binding protein